MSRAANPPTVAPSNGRVYPLEPGDHLTRAEFERRYEAMPELKKAELIEGVVHVPSPVRLTYHGKQHSALAGWLYSYWIHTPGTEQGDNTTVRLDLDNEPQPDLFLMIERARGGQAEVDAEGYVVGGPELVLEVAASSASIDLNTKRKVYQRNGVREYIVWRVLDHAIDWFILQEGQFQPLKPAADGYLHSEVFPGLWLDVQAQLGFQGTEVVRVLQLGIASPEHTAFVSRLQAATPGP